MAPRVNQPQETTANYIVRTEGGAVKFILIKEEPKTRNFCILETVEHFKWVEPSAAFILTSVTGILRLKKGENTQKLEGFRSKSLEALLEKVGLRVREHFANIQ